jgi:hypothetical protein
MLKLGPLTLAADKRIPAAVPLLPSYYVTLTRFPSMLKLGPCGCVMLMGCMSLRHSWPVVALARSLW